MNNEVLPNCFPEKGVYQLLVYLSRPKTIKVGKMGSLDFAGGYYVYTGRAMGGLKARLERHLRKNKKMRWHIDYLLKNAKLVAYQVFPLNQVSECGANEAILSKSALAPIPHFGSSDCKCKSHLAFLGRNDALFYNERGTPGSPFLSHQIKKRQP